jgi:azurin
MKSIHVGILLASALALPIANGATPASKPVAPAAAPAKAPAAAGKVCKLEIAGNDAMQFDKKEMSITADCKVVQLTLKHTGKLPISAMGHNWVLTKTADAMPVNNAGLTVGAAKDHVPPGDKRVIASTKLIGGGQTTSISFPTATLVKGGDYMFFCSFPGHIGLMKGKFLIK